MISVIVPVLNERKALPGLLDHLAAQAGDFEVIVVDGGSTDGTQALADACPLARLVPSRRGRGAQLNAGVREARADAFLFLHADTRLPAGALARLDCLLQANPSLLAGAFRHRFEPADWRLRLVSAGNNLRCRMSRIYFGDQGIFARRSAFERAGGFPDRPVLEDVVFCERLRTFTAAALLDECVTTDSRRFLHHGIWRTTARGVLILVRHRFGLNSTGTGYTDEIR
ncbi:MAG: glycosyltransferase family 2 protein [Frateuria sp.]|nr:glycosyltransferase family 2 protein [Frateuria sp.]